MAMATTIGEGNVVTSFRQLGTSYAIDASNNDTKVEIQIFLQIICTNAQ